MTLGELIEKQQCQNKKINEEWKRCKPLVNISPLLIEIESCPFLFIVQ